MNQWPMDLLSTVVLRNGYEPVTYGSTVHYSTDWVTELHWTELYWPTDFIDLLTYWLYWSTLTYWLYWLYWLSFIGIQCFGLQCFGARNKININYPVHWIVSCFILQLLASITSSFSRCSNFICQGLFPVYNSRPELTVLNSRWRKEDRMGSGVSATLHNSKSLGAITLSGILCVGIFE